jgi:vitamin B12 transporter
MTGQARGGVAALRGLTALAVLSLALASPAGAAGAAGDEERGFLSLYFSDEELAVLSATRSLKAVSGVAENVVVVTAGDIRLANAHTVAEALYNVTGVEITDFKGPGSGGTVSIHGSGENRVTVLLDGVPLNSAMNDFQLATLPVQMIGRIEVVKGPASSAWGSSFGGVINVITKSVAPGDRVDGTLSASVGGQDTSDVRAELSARKDRFGVYLFGGRLGSDGLTGGHEFTHENFFGKLSVDAGARTRVDLSVFSHGSDSVSTDFRRLGQDVAEGFTMDTLSGKADLRTAFGGGVDLVLSAWRIRSEDNFYQRQLSTGRPTRDFPIVFDRQGLSGSLAWRAGSHALVAGADASDESYEEQFGPHSAIDQRRHALFANDTIAAGNLTVTPGVRYDHSTLSGGLVSPSLGATYLASPDLLLRAIVSRGFHDPPIVKYLDAPPLGYVANPALTPEKIWSYQAGVEANVADLLRAKLTLFYHDIDDILVDQPLGAGTSTTTNGGRARTAGGEAEIATNAFRGFVLRGGAHYERTRLIDFSDPRYGDDRQVYGFNAALDYDGKRGLTGTARAHYLWWDMADAWEADSRGIVVDLDAAKTLLDAGRAGLELFGAVHNLFNAHSYNNQFHQNPERWLEAGVRLTY